MTARFLKWSALVAAGVTAGWGIGWGTDRLLATVSWHYVYPPGHACYLGWRLGMWSGACVAVAAVTGRRPPALWSQIGWAVIGIVALVVVGAVAGAGIGLAIALAGLTGPGMLVPVKRLGVTHGLLWGEGLAVVLGTAGTSWRLWRSRL